MADITFFKKWLQMFAKSYSVVLHMLFNTIEIYFTKNAKYCSVSIIFQFSKNENNITRIPKLWPNSGIFRATPRCYFDCSFQSTRVNAGYRLYFLMHSSVIKLPTSIYQNSCSICYVHWLHKVSFSCVSLPYGHAHRVRLQLSEYWMESMQNL